MNIEQHHPKQFLEWLKSKKTIIAYFDKISMRQNFLNLGEIFDQMNSSQKIAVMKMCFDNLLDEDEKSFFLTEINTPVTGKVAAETDCNHDEHEEDEPDYRDSLEE